MIPNYSERFESNHWLGIIRRCLTFCGSSGGIDITDLVTFGQFSSESAPSINNLGLKMPLHLSEHLSAWVFRGEHQNISEHLSLKYNETLFKLFTKRDPLRESPLENAHCLLIEPSTRPVLAVVWVVGRLCNHRYVLRSQIVPLKRITGHCVFTTICISLQELLRR